jgi:hypothetical protein
MLPSGLDRRPAIELTPARTARAGEAKLLGTSWHATARREPPKHLSPAHRLALFELRIYLLVATDAAEGDQRRATRQYQQHSLSWMYAAIATGNGPAAARIPQQQTRKRHLGTTATPAATARAWLIRRPAHTGHLNWPRPATAGTGGHGLARSPIGSPPLVAWLPLVAAWLLLARAPGVPLWCPWRPPAAEALTQRFAWSGGPAARRSSPVSITADLGVAPGQPDRWSLDQRLKVRIVAGLGPPTGLDQRMCWPYGSSVVYAGQPLCSIPRHWAAQRYKNA